jgi:hypothetical protein
VFTAPLKVYPETKGVPLEEMDIVFGEGRIQSYIAISDRRLNIIIGGENKHAGYSSSGGLSRWFKRIFRKVGSRPFTEGEESYRPLRADHDHDEDENDGEEYEMIKRNPGHESESK